MKKTIIIIFAAAISFYLWKLQGIDDCSLHWGIGLATGIICGEIE